MTGDSESENSENKTSLSEWKDAAISLAAFATSKGGVCQFPPFLDACNSGRISAGCAERSRFGELKRSAANAVEV